MGRRVPVVIGVSGVSTAASVFYARHAATIGADAVIAMPPYVSHPPPDEIAEFYAAVAAATDPLPVWIQDFVGPVGTPMSPQLLALLLTEIHGVDYLKEESALATQVMPQVRGLAGDALNGVMGGMAGRYLLEEYRRGVIASARTRVPRAVVLDAENRRELDLLLRQAEPLFATAAGQGTPVDEA